ncbi:MAG TPA: pilus assembly protein PilM [Anaerohalosphaeraceae bacterium]|nr:pilus assembly protein PilM [Anaerohalosphaeraceae bacterium]
MFGKKYGPIGVDLGSGHLRAVQLGQNGQGLFLQAGGIRSKPDEIKFGTPEWQRWALEALREIVRESSFKGAKVTTALPSDDLFIDQVRVPRASSAAAMEQAAFAKVQSKLPFKPEEGLLKYVLAEPAEGKGAEVEVVVMGAGRLALEVHLAIYEQAGLEVAGIIPWPLAMITSYARFFCRRKHEQDRVSILMSVGTHHCNVVICRGMALLFARVVPIGFAELNNDAGMMHRLIAELDACARYYQTMPSAAPIERLVFLAGSGVSRAVCEGVAELAQRMQIAAQVGDVLSAIRLDPVEQKMMIDRRNSKVDWSLAFGLSLQGVKG